ncbi:extracellular solute-binding protein [Clostridiaceae bacterium OttesenSCG-928-D20]|nr:extracellular solute-binding protein [Clostridiaceae bacterium OttesenSCG-928-D20]
MKMRKILSLILAVLMIVSVFSACGNGGSEGEETDPPVSESQKPAPDPDPTDEGKEKVQLSLGIYPVDTDEAAKAEHEKFIAIFEDKYPDVEIVRDNYEYALDTFVPRAEGGQLPVVFTTWFTEPAKIIANGYAADITDYLEERGWLDMINPDVLAQMSRDGRVYGLPRDAYALGLMINLNLFEEAGFKNEDGTYQYPKTWEEVAEFAVTIKEKTGKMGLAMQGQDNGAGWHFSNIAWNFGAEMTVVDPNTAEVTANLNTPEFIEALEYVKSLRWEHDVLLDPSAINWGTGYEALGTGTAAMYIAANDGVNQPRNYGLSENEFAIIPMPAGPGGDQYLLLGGTPYMFSVDASPEQINAALDYIEIMGKVPAVNDDVKEGQRVTFANHKEQGIPVIPQFPIYTDSEWIAMQDEVVAEFSNVNMDLWQDYIDIMRASGKTHAEEPGLTQEMYAQILQALQAVFSDKDADCAKLAETANSNYQKLLDAYYAG